MAIQRSVFLSAAAIAALALQLSGHAWAEVNQSQWEAYSAQEFAGAAGEAFKSPALSEADQQLVSQMAWNRFLTDESFVASGDLKVVRALVNQFAARRSALVSEKVSAEQVESQFASLKAQVIQRLKGERDELGSIGIYELNDLSKSLGMASSGSLEKAELFVAWMETGNWRSLPLTDRYNLYGFINVDAVDRRRLSARWTGSLTAPKTGRYILRQAPQYSGTDSQVKIFLGDELVLDSTDKSLGEARFEGKPLELTAGEERPLRVEMKHEVSRIDWSEGAPMVVISWQLDKSPLEIVPQTAFAPPADFGKPGVNGLKGEYFADLELNALKATRLDSALDLVSSWPPAAALYHEQADPVFGTCVADMLNDANLAEAASRGDEKFFHFSMWRIAYRMSASDRLKLVEALIRTPEALALMTPEAMGRLMQAVYMLPAKEHLTLFGEWASNRPQPVTRAGAFPGWGNGYYQEINTDYYWLMGLFWQRSYWLDVEMLWDDYLTRENGDCNLAIAYATAFAAQKNGEGDRLIERINEKLDDDRLGGDQKATWLIARAFASGALHGTPQPMSGFVDLERAFEIAESSEYRFWVLQEMVVRLASVDQGERAKQLLEQHRGQFTDSTQQAAMNTWSSNADALSVKYSKWRSKAAEESRTAYLKELESRRQRASGQGDVGSASRLSELLESTRSSE